MFQYSVFLLVSESGTFKLQLANAYGHSTTRIWREQPSTRSDRDSHSFRSSLGQQRRSLARGHPSSSNPVVQHWSSLVQRPPLCRIGQYNQANRSILWVDNGQFLIAAASRASLYQSMGKHRILNTAYCHIFGLGDTHLARSHPTASRHMFDRSLTRRRVSRNWCRGWENHHQ